MYKLYYFIKQNLISLIIMSFLFFYRFIPTRPAWSDNDVISCWENTTLFLTSSYQYIILAFVLNKGYPHRKPFYKNRKHIYNILNISHIILPFHLLNHILTFL